MACQEAPALRRKDEGDQPPRATVLAVLEVVESDIAAVFRLLQERAWVLILDRVLCWGAGTLPLGSGSSEALLQSCGQCSCGCISGGGQLVEGVRAWSACPWTSRAHLTGRQRSCECSPEDKAGDGSCAGVHSATHTPDPSLWPQSPALLVEVGCLGSRRYLAWYLWTC